MRNLFDGAIEVGSANDLVERRRDGPTTGPGATHAAATLPSSGKPRGLSLLSLHVTRPWDALWNLLGRKDQIYFLSVAFDLSDRQPVILPPKETPTNMIYKVRRGEAISFSLGDGMPLYPPQVITGGLLTYLVVCDAEQGVRHVGEVMAKVHADLTQQGSLTDKLLAVIKNPASTMVDEVLSAATTALQPVASILQSKGDDFVGVFSGIYPAKGSWKGKLQATQNGTEIELGVLTG